MGELAPFVKGTSRAIVWAPQPGSQEAFLTCPIFETLFCGSRGGGKTDTLLMDFAQHVGKGHGAEWRGILFRKTYPELQDVVEKAKKWFPRIWPDSGMHETKHQWEWATGERLLFRHADKASDYWKYHGCVDEGDVLTTQGWVPIQQVTAQHAVLTPDQSGTLRVRSVLSTTKKRHTGHILRYVGPGYMSFTPEHKLPVATADGSGYTLTPYEALPKHAEVPIWLRNHDGCVYELNPNYIHWDPFDGTVYCIEVEETHSFIIRQRGSTWLSGNSSFPWIAWEELTTWANADLYTSMMSVCRSTVKAIPRKYRATTNPYGPGHNWCKSRFRLPVPSPNIIHTPITDERGQQRVAINSHLFENRVLLHADPGYVARISAAAPNPAALRAWLEGNWDVVAGGMIDDVWVPSVHIIPNIPAEDIPKGWKIDRSYDHGQSRPFSVGWWAESDGTPVTLQKTVFTPFGPEQQAVTVGEVPGDLVRIREWYGWTGEPNKGLNLDPRSEIAPGIRSREENWGLTGRVRPGPADTAIYDSYSPGRSVAGDMKKGQVNWTRADKGPGSRKQGWQQIRTLLRGALGLDDETPIDQYHADQTIIDPSTGRPAPRKRTHPGMWVCEGCTEFIRTVPALPRDGKDPDDVDTQSEDHVGDEVRYRVRRRSTDVKQRNF